MFGGGPVVLSMWWPFDTIGIWIQVLWAWITSHLYLHVKKRCVAIPEWSITAAHAVDDVTNDYRDITAWFDPETWESCVEEYLGWKAPRVDVRYVHTSPLGNVTKYRMIVRPGDECIVPPPKTTSGMAFRGIISATLIPYAHCDGAKQVDVTRRMKKYAGPNKDFYETQGLEVRVLDCFPFDHPEQLVERFESLSILDTSRLLSQEMHVFSLKQNDRIQIL